jgi:hypothetical protein
MVRIGSGREANGQGPSVVEKDARTGARFAAFGVLAERYAPAFAMKRKQISEAKPHAAMALFAAGGHGGGHGDSHGDSHGSHGGHGAEDRKDRYQRIKDQLEMDAQGLDTREVDLAQDVNKKIGHSLLARFEAQTIDSFLAIAFWIFLFAFIVCLSMLVVRTAADAPTAPFGIGAMHSLLGIVLAAVMRALFGQSADAAVGEFRRAETALVELVSEATTRIRDQLVELRGRMQSASPAPAAMSAAAEARLLTATALRFFSQAPLVGVADGDEGHTCHNVQGAVLGAAKRSEAAAWRLGVMLFSALGGAALGVVLLLASAETFALAPLPDFVTKILELERDHRGAISYLLLIVGILIALPILGLLAAQTAAIANPAGVMRREPTRSLANSLQLKALKAAAESRREFIERYVDAVVSLESRATGWGSSSHHKATHSAAELETPYWRRAPEGPRFVATGFQAAPKAFLSGSEAGEGASGRRKSGPKRGLWGRLKPPGL